VVKQVGGGDTLEFIYDNNGRPYAMVKTTDNETAYYYYVLNLQGDVIRLVNDSGATVQEYLYDAWGAPLNTPTGVGAANPLRYRGVKKSQNRGIQYFFHSNALEGFDMIITKKNEDEIDDRL